MFVDLSMPVQWIHGDAAVQPAPMPDEIPGLDDFIDAQPALSEAELVELAEAEAIRLAELDAERWDFAA